MANFRIEVSDADGLVWLIYERDSNGGMLNLGGGDDAPPKRGLELRGKGSEAIALAPGLLLNGPTRNICESYLCRRASVGGLARAAELQCQRTRASCRSITITIGAGKRHLRVANL
jgi:hypothetical protein